MTLTSEHAEWLSRLREFVESRRGGEHPVESDELPPVTDEQRRITGGALLQFLEFVQGERSFERFPVLDEHPISERAFLFATDRAGAAAAEDIIDRNSDRALVILKEEWRAWLEDPSTDSDGDFEHHYECWSVWHQNVDPTWEIPESVEGQLWVHEEGFALADRAGRGSKHLWAWDGHDMTLVEQEVDTWVSRGAH